MRSDGKMTSPPGFTLKSCHPPVSLADLLELSCDEAGE